LLGSGSRPQAMAEGQQDHRAVPMSLPIALGGLDELLDLVLVEVLPRPVFGVRSSASRYCLFFAGWDDQSQCWIFHVNSPVLVVLCMLKRYFMDRPIPH